MVVFPYISDETKNMKRDKERVMCRVAVTGITDIVAFRLYNRVFYGCSLCLVIDNLSY